VTKSIDKPLDHEIIRSDPFAYLGPHPDPGGGFIIRAIQPGARAVEVRLPDGRGVPMAPDGAGVFEAHVEDASDYRFRITYHGGHALDADDPYRYGRVLSDFDLHLLSEGTHHRAFEKLGAHRITVGTTTGVHFAVWAPNADRVSLIGDFNGWDGRVNPMRLLVPSGVWEIFIPDLRDGEHYKFEIRTATGDLLRKSDPFGFAFEVPPQSASIVRDISSYAWHDEAWMRTRREQGAWLSRPMAVYEVHLGA